MSNPWLNEDRRSLVRSLEIIASDTRSPDKVGLCLKTILNDLELDDAPRSGNHGWLFGNELRLVDVLGEQIKALINQSDAIEAGQAALDSPSWPDIRYSAVALLIVMLSNGDFIR